LLEKQHQLSTADNCASMSTLQMGHFLLVRSHWSTHSWWKRCIQGRRLWKRECIVRQTLNYIFIMNKSCKVGRKWQWIHFFIWFAERWKIIIHTLHFLHYTNRGQKLLNSLDHMSTYVELQKCPLRPVIFRHSKDWLFCWLLYFWGLRKSPRQMKRNVGKECSFSHKNSLALKHTRYSITVPDVLPFLQYWQTDGAFLLCVFVRPLIFFLLTMQLSLLMETLENTIIDTQHQKQSSNKDHSYSHSKDVLNREGWDHSMRVTVKHHKCI
jgi:hypothetical protein